MDSEVFWNQRLHAVRAIVLRMQQVAINLEHFTSDSDHVEHLWRALGGLSSAACTLSLREVKIGGLIKG